MSRKGVVQKEKRKRGRPPKKKQALEQAVPVQEIQTAQQPLPDQQPAGHHQVKNDAPETSYFILCNGKPVKNMIELADVMEEMEDQVFNHHVSPEKNDFAKWVNDIFKDAELAEKLAGVKDKKHMQLVLYKHITHKLW
ncbi:hypothetical protein JW756_04915 [Candidatus Woesearchaeota archaeon]|nr:hypothetical protein [Candidatus Woesearchaeota archaeon]